MILNAGAQVVLDVLERVNMVFGRHQVRIKFVPERAGGGDAGGAPTGAGPVCGKEPYVRVANVKVHSDDNSQPRWVLYTSKRAENAGAFEDDVSPHIFIIRGVTSFGEEDLHGSSRSQSLQRCLLEVGGQGG